MKRLIPLVFAAIIATGTTAQTATEPQEESIFLTADMDDLSQFHWKKRPVLVFADSDQDPAYIEQLDLLRARVDALQERDVVVLTDTDPAARGALRLKMRPRGFMLVLVGKDGGVKLRKPFPWDVREITRSIDKMPIRQQEIRDSKDRSGMVIR